ncbi:MAG: ABC transporter substrate-binding protein, partial [Eubacteriales bacterium]|nr:ABC transporter substrate-binding protein [Eubacteriales bacterium]
LLLCCLQAASAETVQIEDMFGNSAQVSPESRVVACHASFAQCWLLSGGELVGVTEDAITDRSLELPKDIAVIGTVKSVDLECLIALEPDYVLLAADLTAHLELEQSLSQMGIAYGYFREDTFAEYAALMQQFCACNDPDGSRYQANVLDVQKRIRSVKDAVPTETDQSFLLLRAYSTGMKAKADDNLAGQILKEFGLQNIVDKTPSLLEDLSMEQILLEDPDYIFVTTMGDEQAAREYLQRSVESDPAWASLSAVQNGRYVVLAQDLFHYKPNNRWDESYRVLAELLYPELFVKAE